LFGHFQYTTGRRKKPLQNALSFFITGTYSCGWKLAKYPATQSLINPKQAGMFGIVILVSVVIALIGNILLGLAIIRTKVMSRWIGLLFIFGWTCFFLGSGSSTLSILKPFGIVLTGVGYIWGGYSIWNAKD